MDSPEAEENRSLIKRIGHSFFAFDLTNSVACEELLAYLEENLGQTPLLGKLRLTGFGKYGNTLEKHDEGAQAKNSLYLTSVWFRDDHKMFLSNIPGLEEVLSSAISQTSKKVGEDLQPIWVHALRQGPNLGTATSFGVHKDNDGDDCSEAMWTIIVKLTKDDPHRQMSRMEILSLPCISYPPHSGCAVAFPSCLYHQSLSADQECVKLVIKCSRLSKRRRTAKSLPAWTAAR